MSYKENIITRHHIKIHDDDIVTDLVIVCVLLAILITMLVLHKCSAIERPVMCCNVRRPNEDMIHVVEDEELLSSVAGMAALLACMKRQDTPPPSYEDPPSYHVALQMEIELTKRELKVPGSS